MVPLVEVATDARFAAFVMVYSYWMLIEPASKVSVPLTVVMTTRSSVPESVTAPIGKCVRTSPIFANMPVQVQILDPNNAKVAEPYKEADEVLIEPMSNPAVATLLFAAAEVEDVRNIELYPVVCVEPEPS